MNARAVALSVIITPATGTHASSIFRRSIQAAKPKPPAMPSDAAAMNKDDMVP